MTTSTTETQETAQATATSTEKHETPKKANTRAQKPRAAVSKGKASKRPALPRRALKAPKKARKAKTQGAREGGQNREGPGTAEAVRRHYSRRDHESDRLAASQRPGIHFRNPGKKMGLKVESAKNEDGERVYSLCGAPHNHYAASRTMPRVGARAAIHIGLSCADAA